jgi:hypothetical protein
MEWREVRLRDSISGQDTRQDPRKELPVSSNPTVKTLRVRHVTSWEIIVEFDIGGETYSGKRTLEEIVTEKGVLRNLSFHYGLKRLDVINPLTDIRAFGE